MPLRSLPTAAPCKELSWLAQVEATDVVDEDVVDEDVVDGDVVDEDCVDEDVVDDEDVDEASVDEIESRHQLTDAQWFMDELRLDSLHVNLIRGTHQCWCPDLSLGGFGWLW